MARQTYRIVLVIGDDHKEIIKKYSADTTVDKHLFMKFDDAALNKLHVMDCIECGLCSYICPSKIDVTENVSRATNVVRMKQQKGGK